MIDHEFGVFATFQTSKKATYKTLDLISVGKVSIPMIFPLNGWLPHDIVQLPQLSPLAPHHRSTSHHLNCAKRFGLLAWRKPDTHRNCMPYQFIHVYHQFVLLSPSNWPFEYSPFRIFRVRNQLRKLSLSTPPDIRYIAGNCSAWSLTSLSNTIVRESISRWVMSQETMPCHVDSIYIYMCVCLIKVSVSVHTVHPHYATAHHQHHRVTELGQAIHKLLTGDQAVVIPIPLREEPFHLLFDLSDVEQITIFWWKIWKPKGKLQDMWKTPMVSDNDPQMTGFPHLG